MPEILKTIGQLADLKNNRLKDCESIAEAVSAKYQDNKLGYAGMLEVTEACAANVPGWLEDYSAAFSFHWSGKRNAAKFRRLNKSEISDQAELLNPEVEVENDDEHGGQKTKKVQFSLLTPEEKEKFAASYGAVAGTPGGSDVSIGNLIQTNILPLITGIILDDSEILSRVNIIRSTDKNNIPEWYAEPTGSVKAENAAHTEVNFDQVDGDLLDPANTMSVYTTVTKLAMLRAQPGYYAQLQAKMYRQTQNLLVNQILNGINSSNNFHGLFVGNGQTGIAGSAAPKRGAFDVTTNLGGTVFSSSDTNLDRLLAVLNDLPENLEETDLNRYVWIGTRRNRLKFNGIKSAQGEYLLTETISEGIKQRNLMGYEYITAHQAPSNKIGFFDLSLYNLQIAQDIMFLSDQGIVNFNTANGKYQLKTEALADGGYAQNLMRSKAWISGNDDYKEFNNHRTVTIL